MVKPCTKQLGMTMTGTNDLKELINRRMDYLQHMMESNMHLKAAENVMIQINSVSKFWSVLSEEDRDYIQAAQYAVEEKKEWKL